MTAQPHPVVSHLQALVGEAHVLTPDRHDLTAYEQDWRKRARGHALAVVRPGSTAEVAAVVKACVAAGVPVVPQGGNTGLVVGSTPDDSGRQVVLHLGRMNAVRGIDTANLTMTVEAGCVLQSVQETAMSVHRSFGISGGPGRVDDIDEVVIPQRTCDAFHRDKRCNHDFFITEICEFLSNELSLRGFIFNRKNDDTRI